MTNKQAYVDYQGFLNASPVYLYGDSSAYWSYTGNTKVPFITQLSAQNITIGKNTEAVSITSDYPTSNDYIPSIEWISENPSTVALSNETTGFGVTSNSVTGLSGGDTDIIVTAKQVGSNIFGESLVPEIPSSTFYVIVEIPNIDLTIRKVWADEEDIDGYRSQSVCLVLYNNGIATQYHYELAGNSSIWEHTFYNIPDSSLYSISEEGETCPPSVEEVKIFDASNNIITDTQQIDFNETSSVQLSAKTFPEEAYSNVVWSTSDRSVASVSSNGLVTFKQAGYVQITATAADGSGVFSSVNFIVSANKYVTQIVLLTPDKTTPGSMESIAANIYPADASNQELSWSITGPASLYGVNSWYKTLVVNSDITSSSVITITASATDGSNVSASAQINVVMLPTSVEIIDSETGAVITGQAITVNKNTKPYMTLSLRPTPSDADTSVLYWDIDSWIAYFTDDVLNLWYPGTATISVINRDGSIVYAQFNINIVETEN